MHAQECVVVSNLFGSFSPGARVQLGPPAPASCRRRSLPEVLAEVALVVESRSRGLFEC